MDPIVLIINPGAADNGLLAAQLAAEVGLPAQIFTDEAEAATWLSEKLPPVEGIFVGTVSERLMERVSEVARREGTPIFQIQEERSLERVKAFQCLNELLDNLLVKPFRPEVLLNRIQSLMRISPVKNPSVLYLDDSGEDKEAIRQVLARCGFRQFYEVSDALSLMGHLKRKSEEIALVVCHWELPSLESVAGLRSTRQTPKFFNQPFIFVTSQATVAEVRVTQQVAQRFSDTITKPFERDRLLAEIDPCLSRIRRHYDVSSYVRETQLFLDRGQAAHAQSLLTHAIKHAPDAPELYEALGDVYRHASYPLGEPEKLAKAASAYELALRASRQDPACLAKAVGALEECGKTEDVVRLIRAFLQRYGFDDTWRLRLARTYLKMGDYGAANVETKRALTVNPANVEGQTMLQLLSSLGGKGEAA